MKNQFLYLLLVSIFGYTQTPCSNGSAGPYPCNGYDLISHLDLTTLNAGSGNDSWGWTDPIDGKEYALIGLNNGTTFIDISQPSSPVYLGKLPTHTSNSQWRDIKVYGNYAFIVSEAGGHGMQVFDLTNLRTVNNPPIVFSEDAHYSGFGSAHNIVINPNQPFAYAVGTQTFNGGPHVVDISDPLNPVFAGGYGNDSYTHDAQVITYNGPDTDYIGKEIYIGSNETEVVILDVTDKTNILNISNFSYSNSGYTHQAWLTEDHTYLLLGDEFDEIQFGFNTRTIILDFTDLDNPTFHTDYLANTSSIDHNGYTKDDHFYLASYTAGLRVIDITDISNQNFTEIGFFDTFPLNDDLGFSGLWNVYPYFDSGNIVLSDINTGFYLVKNSNLSTDTFDDSTSVSIYPNPTSDFVNINVIDESLNSVQVFDSLGRLVFSSTNLKTNSLRIDVSHYSTGIYVMRVNDNTNKRLVIR